MHRRAEAKIAELYQRAVILQAQKTLQFAELDLAFVRLGGDVGDGDSVVTCRHVLSIAGDFERVPLAKWTGVARVGSGDVVDRRLVLIVLQIRVLWRSVVQDLDLESGDRLCVVLAMKVAVLGNSDVHATVAASGQKVIESQ